MDGWGGHGGGVCGGVVIVLYCIVHRGIPRAN